MRLDSTFSVDAPVDQVWETLMDFEKVTACLPGAQVLEKLSEDAYRVGMKVKLGPVSMQYKGHLEVVERDPVAHRALLRGTAKELRGQGTAEATATLSLVEEGGTTRGTVGADVNLSGKAAAMGQGVIGSVTDQMMSTFATNLQAMLTGPLTGPEPAAAEAPPTPGPRAVPDEPLRPAVQDDSLDALGLARGIVASQLAEPRKVVGLLALVALLAYGLGRRGARRSC
jgi:carbon monoxide dehydrogenase subunit G